MKDSGTVSDTITDKGVICVTEKGTRIYHNRKPTVLNTIFIHPFEQQAEAAFATLPVWLKLAFLLSIALQRRISQVKR